MALVPTLALRLWPFNLSLPLKITGLGAKLTYLDKFKVIKISRIFCLRRNLKKLESTTEAGVRLKIICRNPLGITQYSHFHVFYPMPEPISRILAGTNGKFKFVMKLEREPQNAPVLRPAPGRYSRMHGIRTTERIIFRVEHPKQK